MKKKVKIFAVLILSLIIPANAFAAGSGEWETVGVDTITFSAEDYEWTNSYISTGGGDLGIEFNGEKNTGSFGVTLYVNGVQTDSKGISYSDANGTLKFTPNLSEGDWVQFYIYSIYSDTVTLTILD